MPSVKDLIISDFEKVRAEYAKLGTVEFPTGNIFTALHTTVIDLADQYAMGNAKGTTNDKIKDMVDLWWIVKGKQQEIGESSVPEPNSIEVQQDVQWMRINIEELLNRIKLILLELEWILK